MVGKPNFDLMILSWNNRSPDKRNLRQFSGRERKIKEQDMKIKELSRSWADYIDDVFDASGESIGLLKAVCRRPVLQLIRELLWIFMMLLLTLTGLLVNQFV